MSDLIDKYDDLYAAFICIMLNLYDKLSEC